MTVRRAEDGSIVMEGHCPVEDAEPLLRLLQTAPGAAVDWRPCTRLHTAVLQVILAARPALVGRCGDPWVQQWLPLDPRVRADPGSA